MEPNDLHSHGGDVAAVKEQGHHHPHEVIVRVDGRPRHVEPGVYVVSAFKALVGVAADRELDIFEDGVFRPLDDNKPITIRGHEVFVSHVRTGGSS